MVEERNFISKMFKNPWPFDDKRIMLGMWGKRRAELENNQDRHPACLDWNAG